MTVEGTWAITVETPMGRKSGMLNLAVVDGALSGSMSYGEHVVAISEGRLQGTQMQWSAKIVKPMRMTVKITAAVDQDRIEGTAKYLFGLTSFTGARV